METREYFNDTVWAEGLCMANTILLSNLVPEPFVRRLLLDNPCGRQFHKTCFLVLIKHHLRTLGLSDPSTLKLETSEGWQEYNF